MKRPLFVVGFIFGGCLLTARILGFHMALIAAGLSALLFVTALSVPFLRQSRVLLAVLTTALAAFSIFSARQYLFVLPAQTLDGQTRTVTVWLERETATTASSTLYLGVVEEGDLAKGTRLMLWVRDEDAAPQLYDRATARLYLTAEDHYYAEEVYLTAWAQDAWTVERSDRRPPDAWLTQWRETVVEQVDEYLDGEAAALVRGICFGDTSGLSTQTTEDFSDAGLSHLTSVSGFHMSVIALGFFRLLCLCRIRKKWAAVCSLPVPFLFAAVTGFSYSAMRAGIMCLITMLAVTFRRRADAGNSLGGAVLLITVLDPAAVYDLGFLLSVTATLGIICVSGWTIGSADGPARRWLRPVYKAAGAAKITLAATVATMPILALTFAKLSVLSVPSNLLGEPAAAGIVVCGCAGTVAAMIPGLSFVASALLGVADLLARGLLWWSAWVSDLPVSVFLLNRPYLLLWSCAVPFALAFGWWMLKARGLRLTAILLTIALAASSLVYTLGMRGVTTFAITNLSDGAAVLVSRDGHHGLILTGSRVEEAASFLRRQGIDQLDFVLYTNKQEAAPDMRLPAAMVLAPDGEDVTVLDNTASVSFWNDSGAVLHDGWLILTLGERRVILCGKEGDAAVLPADMRVADLLIFDETPPRHVTALAAGEAVLCCAEEDVGTVTKALPWGTYPITMTADDTVTMAMRG